MLSCLKKIEISYNSYKVLREKIRFQKINRLTVSYLSPTIWTTVVKGL